jgi:hypothetical protein
MSEFDGAYKAYLFAFMQPANVFYQTFDKLLCDISFGECVFIRRFSIFDVLEHRK